MSHGNKQRVLLGVSLIFFLSQTTFAADRIKINTDQAMQSVINTEGINMLRTLDKAYSFKTVKSIKLPNGKIKLKQIQLYNGVPVWNNAIIREQNSHNSLLNNTIKGSYLINIEQDLSSVMPSITKEQAIDKAKFNKSISADVSVENINIELVIKTYDGIAKLVYMVDFFIDDPNESKPSRPFIIIDAHTGEILQTWEGLNSENYVDAAGPGGNEKVGKFYYGQEYGPLKARKDGDKCYMDSVNVATYDFKHAPDIFQNGRGGELHSFDCAENTFKEINGAYSPINDAHYFGNVVYDMYKEWYDTAPLTFKLALKVHYRKNHENAYWTGEVMLFGDGASKFYPLVSLDVVGHEVSHGFTQQNSNLKYEKQSGGMNESFSDIAGEAAQYFMEKDKKEDERVDWLVGGGIFKGANGKGLRYFADPTLDGKSIAHTKDYKNSVNVHYSSGIFNKAFYTLANTEGWNVRKAFDAFVLANQTYWTQNSTFDEGGCGVKNAAADLDYEIDDVIKAFDVVGVNATCEDKDPQDPKDPKKPDEPKDPKEPKNPDEPKDPKDPKDQHGAIKLSNGQIYSDKSGEKGTRKLFYFDITKDASGALLIWNWGGKGVADIRVAQNELPTTDNNECVTSKKPQSKTNRSCSISKPSKGRHYIELYSDEEFSSKSLWVLSI